MTMIDGPLEARSFGRTAGNDAWEWDSMAWAVESDDDSSGDFSAYQDGEEIAIGFYQDDGTLVRWVEGWVRQGSFTETHPSGWVD